MRGRRITLFEGDLGGVDTEAPYLIAPSNHSVMAAVTLWAGGVLFGRECQHNDPE